MFSSVVPTETPQSIIYTNTDLLSIAQMYFYIGSLQLAWLFDFAVFSETKEDFFWVAFNQTCLEAGEKR